MPDPVFRLSVVLDSELTFRSLKAVALCLPELERLELYIDANSTQTQRATQVNQAIELIELADGLSSVTYQNRKHR